MNPFLQNVVSRHDILVFLMAAVVITSERGASSRSFAFSPFVIHELRSSCWLPPRDAEGVILVMSSMISVVSFGESCDSAIRSVPLRPLRCIWDSVPLRVVLALKG